MIYYLNDSLFFNIETGEQEPISNINKIFQPNNALLIDTSWNQSKIIEIDVWDKSRIQQYLNYNLSLYLPYESNEVFFGFDRLSRVQNKTQVYLSVMEKNAYAKTFGILQSENHSEAQICPYPKILYENYSVDKDETYSLIQVEKGVFREIKMKRSAPLDLHTKYFDKNHSDSSPVEWIKFDDVQFQYLLPSYSQPNNEFNDIASDLNTVDNLQEEKLDHIPSFFFQRDQVETSEKSFGERLLKIALIGFLVLSSAIMWRIYQTHETLDTMKESINTLKSNYQKQALLLKNETSSQKSNKNPQIAQFLNQSRMEVADLYITNMEISRSNSGDYKKGRNTVNVKLKGQSSRMNSVRLFLSHLDKSVDKLSANIKPVKTGFKITVKGQLR